jgi:hypothetical protein
VGIADILGWFEWLFFLPGSSLMRLIESDPAAQAFFEPPSPSSDFWSSALISIALWVLLLALLRQLLVRSRRMNRGAGRKDTPMADPH